MELKTYLAILLKKWWIVIPTFLITLTSGIVFTYTQTPIYSATATYVVVPSSSFGDVRSFANGLDILGRREEIATTFAEIAASRRIKKLALDSLSFDSGQDYLVSSILRAGTNIIEITVEGPNPTIVKELANEVGITVEKYVQGLYEVFMLAPLDRAIAPLNPSNPNIPLNLALSAILGLALGGGLAFLSEYLETPLNHIARLSIIDEETGLYNQEYFSHRLGEEMIRAKRNRYPLSLAMMRIDNISLLHGEQARKMRSELLRQVALLTSQYLREEDIVAYLNNNMFGLLLPDVTGDNAKALMEYVQTRIAWTPFETSTGMKFNLESIIGITAYLHNGTSREELVSQANRAMQLAETANDSKTHLFAPSDQGETNGK